MLWNGIKLDRSYMQLSMIIQTNTMTTLLTPDSPNPATDEGISPREFLENISPGQERIVANAAICKTTNYGNENILLSLPELTLHCESKVCDGMRVFSSSSEIYLELGKWKRSYVQYLCRNCKVTVHPATASLRTKDGREPSPQCAWTARVRKPSRWRPWSRQLPTTVMMRSR